MSSTNREFYYDLLNYCDENPKWNNSVGIKSSITKKWLKLTPNQQTAFKTNNRCNSKLISFLESR